MFEQLDDSILEFLKNNPNILKDVKINSNHCEGFCLIALKDNKIYYWDEGKCYIASDGLNAEYPYLYVSLEAAEKKRLKLEEETHFRWQLAYWAHDDVPAKFGPELKNQFPGSPRR